MQLGCAYNVFDGEELLEASIRSIRAAAQHVVVVYQTVSNFGNACHPGLVPLLEQLKASGLVDELVAYDSSPPMPLPERTALLSASIDPERDLGGAVETVGTQVHSLSLSYLFALLN